MDLDIRTISVIVAIAYILQTLALVFLYLKNKKYPGITWWTLGSAITAIGFILFLVRDFSQNALISIILPNALVIAGSMFIYIGIMRFLERRENQRLVFSVFAAFIALYFFFTYVSNDINSRTVIVSIALVFYLLLTVHALLRKNPNAITDSSHFIAAILFSEACFLVFRTFSVLTFAPVETLFTPTLIQTMVFVVYFVAGILVTFGLIFMVTQRLNAEVIDAKDHLTRKNDDLAALNEELTASDEELRQSNDTLIRSEHEIAVKNAHLQGLFDYSSASLVLFDAKNPYTVIAHNKYYQQLWAEPFRSNGLMGKNLYDFVPEVEVSGVMAVYDEVVATRKAKTLLNFPYDGMERGKTYLELAPVPGHAGQ